MTVRVHQIDSFTDVAFTGNPAGVVTGGSHLDDSAMQALARELNNTETAFVLPAEGPDHAFRLRYFTTTTEVPSCGHATLAALVARAIEDISAAGRHTFLTGAGLMEGHAVDSADGWRATMRQGKFKLEPPLDGALCDALLAALGIRIDERDTRAPIQVASTGHSKVLIGVAQRQTVERLEPDMAALTTLSEAIGSNGFLVFTLAPEESGVDVAGRMFAPAIGIPEDPVTGNANGPLGAYLLHHGLRSPIEGRLMLRAAQGSKMGRPGYCDVDVRVEGSDYEVTIGGAVTPIFSADLDRL